MNWHPGSSLNACLSETSLWGAAYCNSGYHGTSSLMSVSVTYAAHKRNKGRDMCVV